MVEQITRWGKQFVAGTGIASTAPSVAALGVTGSETGRFVIVWAQGATDVASVGDTEGIVGQLYNGDGSKDGGAFLVNSTTEATQIAPSVVDRVDDEGFAVAWTDSSRVNEGFGADVRMRLFDVNAAPAAGDFIVHATNRTFNNEGGASIDRIGTFGTIFVGFDNGGQLTPNEGDLNSGVRGRAFSNATPLQNDFAVTNADPHAGENNFQAQVDVADLPSTGFLVTWIDNLAGGVSFGTGTAVRGRLYSQLGVQIGTEFNIATNANAVLNHVASVGMQDGSFAVAWTQDDDPTSGGFDRNIYARVFPSGAASGGTPFLVGSAADQQDHVALAAFGPNKFIAAWSHQVGTDFSVHARIFNSNGTPFSEEFVVNSAESHTEALPSIAVLQEATGPRFVISWRDQTSSAIEGQIFTTDGATGGLGIDFFGSGANETYTAQYDEHVLWGNGGTDALTGSALADSLNGGTGNDTLNGGGGNDKLDGGTGADSANGGSGDDLIYVDSASDAVVEGAGGGTADRVLASVSYTLGASAQVELLTTRNNAGTGAINLTGNGFANTIFGNAGVNWLDGKGGADSLIGFGGNDFFFVDSAADAITEGTGGGTGDRVLASVSYTLGAGDQVEIMSTTNNAGVGAINLTGNEFANTIFGNAGANTLDGKGGVDTLVGFAGNDFFFVDNAADALTEGTGGGAADRVLASVSYTLGAGDQVEIMSTTNNAGVGAINLTGNEFANTIFGNAGANVLNGKGGADTLVGSGGNDFFLFDTALNAASNVDHISGFSVVTDTVRLENAIFTTLLTGPLVAGAFRIGSGAADADDRIIYNSATGAVIYDSNGNAAGGATQFATLATGLLLTNADFVIV